MRAVALVLLATTAAAHPTYIALAEVEHRGGALEVAFYAPTHDFESVLPKLEGAEAYFREHFVVTGADGKVRPLKWVGHEEKVHDAWFYFEIPLAKLEGATLRCTVLLARSTKQVTTVRVGKRTLHFSSRAATHPLTGGPGGAAP